MTENGVLPALQKLQEDDDADVRSAQLHRSGRNLTRSYFAGTAYDHTISMLSGEPMGQLPPNSPSAHTPASVPLHSRKPSGQMPLLHITPHSRLSPIHPTAELSESCENIDVEMSELSEPMFPLREDSATSSSDSTDVQIGVSERLPLIERPLSRLGLHSTLERAWNGHAS